jgi:hypothetical protein
MNINPANNFVTGFSVLYGDASSVPGSLVWVAPGPEQGTEMFVFDGDSILPEVVIGTVIAPALASDLSARIIQFDFRRALVPDSFYA